MSKVLLFCSIALCYLLHGCALLNRHHEITLQSWGVVGDEIVLICHDRYYRKVHPIGELLLGETSLINTLSAKVFEVRYSLNATDNILKSKSVKILFDIDKNNCGNSYNFINGTNNVVFMQYDAIKKMDVSKCYDLSNNELKDGVSVGEKIAVTDRYVYSIKNKRIFRFDGASLLEEPLSQTAYDFLQKSHVKEKFVPTSVKDIFFCWPVPVVNNKAFYTLFGINDGKKVREIALLPTESLSDIWIDDNGHYTFFAEGEMNKQMYVYDNEGEKIKGIESKDYGMYSWNYKIDAKNHRILFEDMFRLFSSDNFGSGKILIWDYEKNMTRLLTLMPWD